jgi:hypothetical protein
MDFVRFLKLKLVVKSCGMFCWNWFGDLYFCLTRFGPEFRMRERKS